MPTFPSIQPTSAQMRKINPTRITTTLNGIEQRESSAGQYFALILEFNNLSQSEQRQIQGLFAETGGAVQTFDYQLPDFIGDSTGTYSAGISMTSTYGAGVSTVLINAGGSAIDLQAGDVVTFTGHDKVYMLTADTVLDSGSNYILKIDPPLRAGVSATTAVTHKNVTMKARFASDNQEFDVDPNLYANFSIEIVEVL
jgi:hypothetical protein